MRRPLALALLGLLSCKPPPQPVPTTDAGSMTDAGPATSCDAYGAVEQLPAVQSNAITEASGLAASSRDPGVAFTHNDSGDTARFFAIELATGALKGEFHLAGDPVATDWEDMASGPCPAGRCLYLGDIGDNAESRSSYVVHRVTEPALPADPSQPVTLSFESFPFTYPDGSHNAETLLVHGVTGQMYVVTKTQAGPSGVYRFPALTAGQSVVLEKVGELTAPDPNNLLLTAGDLNPDGSRLLLRSYTQVYELRTDAGSPFESLLGARWIKLPTPGEIQGEGVAYLPGGQGYITISEGAHPTPYQVRCRE